MRIIWKITKVILFFLLGLLILLFVAGFFIEPFAKRLLVQEVGKAGKGQYALRFDDIDVSLLRGNIRLSGIRFLTDTAGEQLAPVAFAEAEELSVEGASWLTYLTSKRLFLDKIYLKDLRLRLKARSTGNSSPNEPFQLSQLDIYPKIREKLRLLALENLSLNGVDFQLINITSGDTLHLTAGMLDLHSENILVEAEKLITSDRAFYAGLIDLDAGKLRLSRTGSLNWQGEAERFTIESQQQKISVAAEDLLFLQKKDRKDTLLFASLREFTLEELNLQKLQEEEVATLAKFSLRHANVLDYSRQPKDNSAGGGKESQGLNVSELSLGKYLPPFISLVDLEELEIEDFTFSREKNLLVKEFNLLAREVLIDSTSAFGDKQFLHAGLLNSSLDSLFLLAENSGYSLRLGGFTMEAEEGEGTISFGRFSLEPLRKNRTGFWLEGNSEELVLENIDAQSLAAGRLALERVFLQSPVFYAHLPPQQLAASASSQSLPTLSLYPAIEDYLQVLRLGEVLVKDGSLKIANLGGKGQGLEIPDFSLLLDDVLITETGAFEEERVLHSRDIQLELAGLRYPLPGSIYTLETGELEIGTASKLFRLKDMFYFVNETHKKALAAPEREQLYRLSNQLFKMEGVDFQKLLEGEGLYANKISTKETDFRIYGDPYAGKGEVNREKEAPMVAADTAQFLLADLNISNELSGFLPEVRAGELEVENLDVWQMKKLKLENFSLQASDILLDELSAFTDNRFLHARSLQANFDSLWVYTIDPRQHYLAAGFRFSATNGLGELAIDQLLAIAQEFQEEKGWLEADIANLKIKRINSRQLPEGQLSVGQIKIAEPELTYFLPAPPAEEEEEMAASSQAADLYPAIDKFLNSFRLDSLLVEDGKLRLAGLGGSTFGLAVPNFNLLVTDVLLAEGTAFADERILHSADIRLGLEGLTYLLPDRVYTLQLDEAFLSTADKSLGTRNFRYMYGENYEQILQAPEVNEVYRFYNREMFAEGVNFKMLFKEKGFYADRILADSVSVYVFKNFNRPESGERTPMPAEMIRDAGIPLAIDSLLVKDMVITYEEIAEGAERAGLVYISDVEVLVENMSNVEEILQQEPLMKLTASGKLMEEGDFQTKITVPLLDKEGLVRVSGNLDTLDATKLNRIARFNSRLAIESGKIYEVLWDFKAGEDLAQGSFEVSYEDLSVQLSAANSPDTTGILKDVGSFLANALILDSSIAEEKTTEPKKVTFKQKREKSRSFFHYYVQSLLAGFREALEIPFQ